MPGTYPSAWPPAPRRPTPSSPSASTPRPRRRGRLPRAMLPASSALRRSSSRRLPGRGRGEAESRLLQAFGAAEWQPSSGSGLRSRRTSRSGRRERGDIGSTRRARPSRVRCAGRRCRDRQPVLRHDRGDAAARAFFRPVRHVLCRTSNDGAGDPPGPPRRRVRRHRDGAVHERIARRAVGWGPGGTVGLVVGATAPRELAAIRVIAPGPAFLVPGVGAQGRDLTPSSPTARRPRHRAGGRPGWRAARQRPGAGGGGGGARAGPGDLFERVARPLPSGLRVLCYPCRRGTPLRIPFECCRLPVPSN